MPSSVINSDDGVISGTSGLKSSGGDDGVLKIQTNGTDAASVTSGQVVSFVNNFGTVANLPAYQCRAWVNFDGTTATPSTIRGSGNVSSVTKNGTGDYTVNFTTAMPDVNFSVLATSNDLALSRVAGAGQSGSTSSIQILSVRPGVNYEDSVGMFVAIFR